MLNLPIQFKLPDVIGCRLFGEPPLLATPTDLVLIVTKVRCSTCYICVVNSWKWLCAGVVGLLCSFMSGESIFIEPGSYCDIVGRCLWIVGV